MVHRKRWELAQEYERSYWTKRAEQIVDGVTSQLTWYQWRAEQLLGRLNALGLHHLTKGDGSVIEIGSGPVGLSGFFPAGDRLLVDPLEDHYSSIEVLRQLRNPRAIYRQGVGENLPAPTSEFDLAIIENCIDHVRDVDAVLREIHRVLRSDGVVYLTVNCRTPLGYVVHRTLSSLRIDSGHPHTFTPQRARELVTRHHFQVLHFEIGSYVDARAKDLQSPDAKTRLKGRLRVSEFVTSIIAKRR